MTISDDNQPADRSRREFLKGVALAGMLQGRKATTVPKCALDITSFGGSYVDQPHVRDGNVISCRTWHDYGTLFMKDFIRMLKSGA